MIFMLGVGIIHYLAHVCNARGTYKVLRMSVHLFLGGGLGKPLSVQNRAPECGGCGGGGHRKGKNSEVSLD